MNAKKGVFQITVDLKSLQIKIAITNFVLLVTKCQFKMVFQKKLELFGKIDDFISL